MSAISSTRTIDPLPRRAPLDGAQVDLGLARGRDAVQQQRAAVARRRLDRPERVGLVVGEGGGASRAGASPPTVSSARVAGARASSAMTPSAAMRRRVGMVVPAARHGSAAPWELASARTAATTRRRALPGSGPPAARAAVRRGRAPVGGGDRSLPAGAAAGALGAGRQHRPQAGGGRRQVVAGRPERGVQQVCRHRRGVDDARERRQAALVGRRAPAGDDAQHAPPPQRARGQRPGTAAVSSAAGTA